MVRALCLAALVVSGCASDDSVVEVGQLGYENQMPLIVIPSTATVGEPFTVDITTDGDGCITAESTDLAMTDNQADITPYDRRRIPGEHEGCILILVPLDHTVSLSFATPGVKTIQVHARLATLRGEEMGVVPMQLTVQ